MASSNPDDTSAVQPTERTDAFATEHDLHVQPSEFLANGQQTPTTDDTPQQEPVATTAAPTEDPAVVEQDTAEEEMSMEPSSEIDSQPEQAVTDITPSPDASTLFTGENSEDPLFDDVEQPAMQTDMQPDTLFTGENEDPLAAADASPSESPLGSVDMPEDAAVEVVPESNIRELHAEDAEDAEAWEQHIHPDEQHGEVLPEPTGDVLHVDNVERAEDTDIEAEALASVREMAATQPPAEILQADNELPALPAAQAIELLQEELDPVTEPEETIDLPPVIPGAEAGHDISFDDDVQVQLQGADEPQLDLQDAPPVDTVADPLAAAAASGWQPQADMDLHVEALTPKAFDDDTGHLDEQAQHAVEEWQPPEDESLPEDGVRTYQNAKQQLFSKKILLGIVGLIVVAFLAFHFLGSSDDTSSPTTPSPSAATPSGQPYIYRGSGDAPADKKTITNWQLIYQQMMAGYPTAQTAAAAQQQGKSAPNLAKQWQQLEEEAHLLGVMAPAKPFQSVSALYRAGFAQQVQAAKAYTAGNRQQSAALYKKANAQLEQATAAAAQLPKQ